MLGWELIQRSFGVIQKIQNKTYEHPSRKSRLLGGGGKDSMPMKVASDFSAALNTT